MERNVRNQIYRRALELLRTNKGPFSCCAAICRAASEQIIGYEEIWDIEEFPELLSFQPEDKTKGEYWWNPNRKRIRISVLKQCIESTL